jgi:hypothetical protein
LLANRFKGVNSKKKRSRGSKVLTVKRKGAESFMHEISNKLFLKD